MATFGPTIPSKDAALRQLVPTFNYGALSSTYLINTSVAGRTNVSIWSWDVSSIPIGATVSSASLDIKVSYWNAVDTGVTYDGFVYPLTRDYTEGTGSGSATGDGATWNTYDGSSNWTTAGGDYDNTAGSAFNMLYAAVVASYTFDVTTAVQSALDDYRTGGGLIGLLAVTTGTETANQYCNPRSRTGPGGTEPTLTIVYTSGIANLKTMIGVAKASIKTIAGTAIASVKSVSGVV